MVRSGRNSNSFKILCMSSLPASIKRIGSKTTEKRWRHRFPHYKPMGAFCCYGNQSFEPICPKTIRSSSPTPVMLHIIFDQDWPHGFRDIQVWKCGRRRTTDDDDDGRRRTDDGTLANYKLTLWAFGSGELKKTKNKKKKTKKKKQKKKKNEFFRMSERQYHKKI